MIRRLLVVWLLLCGVVFTQQTRAYWQSVPQQSVGASSPAFVFRGVDFYNGALTTHTASIDIGTASADRLVIVGIAFQNALVVSSVTVNLTPLTLDVVNPTSAAAAIYSGLVTTGDGTNGGSNVVVTYVSGGFNNRGMTVWTATGLASNLVKQTVSFSAGTTNAPISVTAGDFMFAQEYLTSGTETFATSTQAPGATHTSDATNMAADWTIVSTNAAFSLVSTAVGRAGVVGATYR